MLDDRFDEFWAQYPRRVGKLAAQKAYRKALSLATHDEIMAGLSAYLVHKPDWQQWAHASSWLNAGRWMDEYETAAPAAPPMAWWDECKAIHGGACTKRWDHDMRKRAEE